MSRLLREPLFHFLVLGALLFAIYGALNRDAIAPNRIVVDQTQVDALVNQHQLLWQRRPTAQELQALLVRWVEEEILYREGLASGLDKGDPLVRNRVVQKMKLMSEDMATYVPTDAELQDWMEKHPENYRIPPSYSLRQVYFDPQRHGQALNKTVKNALAVLNKGDASTGDPTPLPPKLDSTRYDEVRGTFGKAFADAMGSLPEHQWQGPVRSGYGLHLVRIESRVAERAATLAEVRPAVTRDFMKERTDKIVGSYFDGIRQHYTVEMNVKLPLTAAPEAFPGNLRDPASNGVSNTGAARPDRTSAQ
jgi:hypothetical protein